MWRAVTLAGLYRFPKTGEIMTGHYQEMGRSGSRSRLGALLSLATLLSHFLLPLVFYVHLTKPPAVSATQFNAGPAPSLSQTEGSFPTPHDANNCPICQAASSFQHYACYALPPVPESASPAGPCFHRIDLPLDRVFCLSVSIPRAPPTFF